MLCEVEPVTLNSEPEKKNFKDLIIENDTKFHVVANFDT